MLLNLEKILNLNFFKIKFDLYNYDNKFFLRFLFLNNCFIKFNFFKLLKILNFYKKIFILFFFQKIIFKNFKKLNLNNVNIYNYKFLINLNPLILLKSKISNILEILDFKSINGPDIENNLINFKYLNILNKTINFKSTFYLKNFDKFKLLLRTHTSSIQIRNFMYKNFFYKFYSIGFTYRNDRDSKHLLNFNQIEIIIIKKSYNIYNLKYFFIKFLFLLIKKSFFYRFRNSYFPFTDFSLEVDIFYNFNWIELAGLGIINEKIINNFNINYNVFFGGAIGLGLERLLMILYKIKDLNIIYKNDVNIF